MSNPGALAYLHEKLQCEMSTLHYNLIMIANSETNAFIKLIMKKRTCQTDNNLTKIQKTFQCHPLASSKQREYPASVDPKTQMSTCLVKMSR